MNEVGMSEWAAKYGPECLCTVWSMIFDFGTCLNYQGVRLHHCWVTRNNMQAPHSSPTNAGVVSQMLNSQLPELGHRMTPVMRIASSSTECTACIQTLFLYSLCHKLGR